MNIAPYSNGTKTILETAAHCLKLPGNLLSVSTLLDKKKFRTYGHKIGAVSGFRLLQDDGLGTLEPCGGRGQNKVKHSAFMLNTYENVIASIRCSHIVQKTNKALTHIYVTFPAECVLSQILLSTICKNYVCVDL